MICDYGEVLYHDLSCQLRAKKESKPEVVKTKPIHGLAVDLPTNDTTSNPPGVPTISRFF